MVKKYIILKIIVLMTIINVVSYAMDENDSDFSDSSVNSIECELNDNLSERYIFTDWMFPLGKNYFNNKDPIEQNKIKKNVARNSFQIAKLICKNKEDQNRISIYIFKIANDENPIDGSPLLAMENKDNPNHQLVNDISKVLYKIVTGDQVIKLRIKIG